MAEEKKYKYLCPGCTNEAFFTNEIVKKAPIANCFKCGRANDPIEEDRFVAQ